MSRRRNSLTRGPCPSNPHFAPYHGEDSLFARCKEIIAQLSLAEGGLTSRHIRLDRVPRRLKQWTLAKLIRLGRVCRHGEPGTYVYELCN